MLGQQLGLIQKISVWLLPVLFAITFHEVAHGWVASLLGDQTAKRLGRLSLNPLKHIDPIGTVLVPALLLFLGGFIFGWAKPVPVYGPNLRHPKRDMALVAAAGPIANLIMGCMWAGVAKIGQLWLLSDLSMPMAKLMVLMGIAGITINVLLCVFNLLPLPPLDGGRVVSSLLPGRMAYHYDRIEPYGFFILLAMLVLGWIHILIAPLFFSMSGFIFNLFGIQAG